MILAPVGLTYTEIPATVFYVHLCHDRNMAISVIYTVHPIVIVQQKMPS
jgi:hypothetical protein